MAQAVFSKIFGVAKGPTSFSSSIDESIPFAAYRAAAAKKETHRSSEDRCHFLYRFNLRERRRRSTECLLRIPRHLRAFFFAFSKRHRDHVAACPYVSQLSELGREEGVSANAESAYMRGAHDDDDAL